jgi:hypothetical protein
MSSLGSGLHRLQCILALPKRAGGAEDVNLLRRLLLLVCSCAACQRHTVQQAITMEGAQARVVKLDVLVQLWLVAGAG